MSSQAGLVPPGCRAPPAPERRNAVRHTFTQEIALRPLQSEASVRWANVLNLSRTGVGLILSCPFKRGTRLAMEFRARPSQPPTTVVGRVLRVQHLASGNAYLGCAFEQELPDNFPGMSPA